MCCAQPAGRQEERAGDGAALGSHGCSWRSRGGRQSEAALLKGGQREDEMDLTCLYRAAFKRGGLVWTKLGRAGTTGIKELPVYCQQCSECLRKNIGLGLGYLINQHNLCLSLLLLLLVFLRYEPVSSLTHLVRSLLHVRSVRCVAVQGRVTCFLTEP